MTLPDARKPGRVLLWAELLLAFGGLPVVLGYLCPPVTWIFVLWALALSILLAQRRGRLPVVRKYQEVDLRRGYRTVFLRFGLVSAALVAVVWFWLPGRFLALPVQRPLLWGAIVVLYPVASVFPQELVYRRWFFLRYAALFGDGEWIVLASALFFGWAHIVMQNGVAIGLSAVGGWFFARTYRRVRSLSLVCLEHALYGDLVFTIGLGVFFFHGMVK